MGDRPGVGFNRKLWTITSGGLGGTRTPDALLRTEALYPLSYEAGMNSVYSLTLG